MWVYLVFCGTLVLCINIKDFERHMSLVEVRGKRSGDRFSDCTTFYEKSDANCVDNMCSTSWILCEEMIQRTARRNKATSASVDRIVFQNFRTQVLLIQSLLVFLMLTHLPFSERVGKGERRGREM